MLPVDVLTNANVDNKHIKSRYASNGMYIMIPKSSKRAVEAVKYLDWMASDNNLIDIQNGVEGENYDLIDGIPVLKQMFPASSPIVYLMLATYHYLQRQKHR